MKITESIHKYAKVGLVHFMAYPSTIKGEGPFEETIRKIAVDDYFDAIEISWIKDAATRSRVKRILDSSHLSVAYGGQPRLLTTGQNINDLDQSKRLEAVANLKDGIDEAYEMGAVGFAFLSGRYTEEKKEEAYQALVASTKEICAYAATRGDMKIAHEVFDYDIDKCSLIGPVDLAKRYAEEVTAEFDNFGLMVDLSHLPIMHETPRQSLIPVKDYVIHAHMGNCMMQDKNDPAYGDAHPRFGYPGGENDVPELVEYLKVLLEIGYLDPDNRRFLSFEVKPVGDEDPDLVVANAKRVLNLAWAQL
ncbi:sugar phosphate isomerase/epimerase family protein [Novipirellula artificiosorum]|uniref:Xylose isomerase-like TIM barrel n=1 Tax=Novipirellula artificiosorum TaxID=2528016 RepID=A0A5C6D305_9BACT|nr:sugar phosphate isomerase/epimerase [Novipirellula artificiosorum]TWU31220.1 Xylose isomerase-like TIM barrel [Novipirellula artificiosorum]